MSAHEESKARRIACRDVVPGCSFTASAGTEEKLMDQVVEHAKEEHGVTEVSPELAAEVKAAMTRQ